jgi:23S rRNA (uracil1939-C5)-methyltransferase
VTNENRTKDERVLADPTPEQDVAVSDFTPQPQQEPLRPELIEATIEKLVYGGEGLARVNGRVVLVPFVLPGEDVLVEAGAVRKDVLRGRLVEIKTASPQRIKPECPYFTRCGGCHYQHAEYAYQLEQKVQILREVFERVGRIDIPGEIQIVSAEPYAYRNRTQFHIDGFKIGYLGAGSHNVVKADVCPISSPTINRVLKALHGMRRSKRFPYFLRSVEVFTDEKQVQLNVLETERPIAKAFFEWAAQEIEGLVSGPIDYDAAGFRFRVSHKSFFQVNRFLIDRLVETAIKPLSGRTVLDLYAGVGLFSIPLARMIPEVIAVESSASAVDDLAFNADRAGVKVKAVKSGVEQFLAGFEGEAQAILADPPRSGLGPQAVRQLLRVKAPKLVIVACDPATLARDLKALTAGGYRLEQVTFIDLFPQTYHLETIVQLSAI